MSAVGLIVLAAGASTRMGMPKQLLQFGERSLISHVVEVAIASVCNPIIVVLGASGDRIKPEVEPLDARVVENPYWAEGMSTSIRTGIETLNAINPEVEAVLLMLCDQPFVSTQIIDQLVTAYRATGKPIIASEYAEISGVPALFSRALFSELSALSGDVGARQVIKQHAQAVFAVPFPEGVIDLDTPKDYEAFQAQAVPSMLQVEGHK